MAACVLVASGLAWAGDGSVEWPAKLEKQLLETCPPGTQMYCYEICIFWDEKPEPKCEMKCSALWLLCEFGCDKLPFLGSLYCSQKWCEDLYNGCVENCPKVKVCYYWRTICQCVPAVPYRVEKGAK